MEIETEGGFWMVLALMILLFPLHVVAGVMTAAICHELGHVIAISICGGYVRRLILHPGGARLETDYIPPGRELICALAGPAAGALTFAVWEFFPTLALAGAIQTMFNLLPLYPLDGGRAWQAVKEIRKENRGKRAAEILKK